GLGHLRIVDVVNPQPKGFLQLCGDVLLQQAFHHFRQLASAGSQGQIHAVTELGVVLKQGVGPAWPLPILVEGVGAGGCAAAVDGGAACGVGNNHSVAEQLGGQLNVGRFAAACAGAGELEQRLPELASLDVVGRNM